MTHQNNKWKRLFYILFGINIIFFACVLILMFWPISGEKLPERDELKSGKHSEFIIRTTKKNLNDLVNAYLDQLLENSKHYYQISLEEDVHLLGELPVFSTTVPLSVHLEPIVQENGDVILKQKSISVGLLQLPNKQIMKYMKSSLPVPDWVVIDPKKEEVYIAVTEMEIKSNFHVSVERIDLVGNHIAIKLKVPYETLGIESQVIKRLEKKE